jgi:predicted HTH domain antitoxin
MDIRYDDLPNVRDGLTRKDRVILYCIQELQHELDGRNVPTAMLYGRVVEYVDMSVDEMQLILQRLVDNAKER